MAFLSDALGSTVGLVNAAGGIDTSYAYQPFGAGHSLYARIESRRDAIRRASGLLTNVIGSHALSIAERLLTRDHGFTASVSPGLRCWIRRRDGDLPQA